ncbi:MAG: methionine synthase [Chitinivibrionales bacterium]|nr:methionine synthase [Chitinivibrionales bacterium]
MNNTGTYKEFSTAVESLRLPAVRVLNAMGYADGSAPEPVPELVDDMLSKAPGLCDCRGIFCIMPPDDITPKSNSIQCRDIEFSTGRRIAGELKESETICLFLVSIGAELESLSKKYLKGDDPLKGYIIDVLASEITESAADLFVEMLQKSIAETGRNMTNRFSPGYCGWSVAEQKKLFSFFPENSCGITLSDSCLMHPIKSVSGIIGLGKDIKKMPYPCDLCEMKDCIKRKLKMKGAGF